MALLIPAATTPSGIPYYSYLQNIEVHVFSSISAYTGIFMSKGMY